MTARTLEHYVAAGVVTAEEARRALGGRKKRSKYGAVRCTLDGFSFDSKREMQRYCALARRQKAGEIRGLFVHPVYPIKVLDVHVCDYEADFSYVEVGTGTPRVEDVKGGMATQTALFRLKAKLFRICYPHLTLEIVT